MASTGTALKSRPLSPHLGIYRRSLTMMMSITHRITGVGLYIGVLLLAWFLLALSGDARTFAAFSGFIHSFIGQLLLLGFTWALFHHLLGGLRHFLWDAGVGFEAPMRDRIAKANLIGGAALTLIAWIIGYSVR
jgi:succinate dehydrogenase / fumarate reductase cytochrome b subunit